VTTKLVPDEELMLQVRNGADHTLAVLFDRYQGPLFNFYAKLTGDRTLSEDLVQEVFLRILKYRHSYTPQAPFRAWIYQIARNARVDHLRKQRPETEWTPEMEQKQTASLKDTAQQKQEEQLLHHALLQLPEEKREVLVLSRLQELKYEEIAQLLGCNVNTLKVRIHRALEELRKVYHQLQASPQGIPSRGAGSAAGSTS
jgi:RNA polymerase sigma-70 factor (ECF subfamily)